MRKQKILICLLSLLIFCSCKENNFVNYNFDCIYRNYSIPLNVGFNLSSFSDKAGAGIQNKNGVYYLNTLYFTKSKGKRIPDSVYKFLYNEYINSEVEFYLNQRGENYYHAEILSDSNSIKQGCFYFCGKLNIHNSIISLLFVHSIYKDHFSPKELLLYNFKENKLCSVIKLSNYNHETKEEDIINKSYYINQGNRFLYISKPREKTMLLGDLTLKKKNDKVSIENSPIEVKAPIFYSLFDIEETGYICFVPAIMNTSNLDLIVRKGKMIPLIAM